MAEITEKGMKRLDWLLQRYKRALTVAKEIEKDGLVHSVYEGIVEDISKLKTQLR